MKPLLLLFLLTFACTAAAQKPAPAKAGPGWTADPKNGCKVWNTQPDPVNDRIEWQGPCVKGLAHGRGVLKWYSGRNNYETDEGEFRAGRLNGQAVITYDDGARFEGLVRNEKPHGEGTWRTAAGEVYAGKWNMGCFNQDGRIANVNVPKSACEVKKKK